MPRIADSTLASHGLCVLLCRHLDRERPAEYGGRHEPGAAVLRRRRRRQHLRQPASVRLAPSLGHEGCCAGTWLYFPCMHACMHARAVHHCQRAGLSTLSRCLRRALKPCAVSVGCRQQHRPTTHPAAAGRAAPTGCASGHLAPGGASEPDHARIALDADRAVRRGAAGRGRSRATRSPPRPERLSSRTGVAAAAAAAPPILAPSRPPRAAARQRPALQGQGTAVCQTSAARMAVATCLLCVGMYACHGTLLEFQCR